MKAKSIMDTLIQDPAQFLITFQDQDTLCSLFLCSQAAASPAGPPPMITISLFTIILSFMVLALLCNFLVDSFDQSGSSACFVISSMEMPSSRLRISIVLGEQKPD